MKELNDAVKAARQKHPKSKDPRKYVSTWKEKDMLEGKVVDAFVMILRTRGCAWALKGGCSMCGYINDAAGEKVEEKDISYQFESAMQNFSGEKIVKIYTSGSFCDEGEIPIAAQERILELLEKKTERVVVETRPEFATEERLIGIKNKEKIEVAIGLESANDFLLENSINKGFKVENYFKAAEILKSLGIGLKTYLLIKPPFLSEKEAIEDAVRSAALAAEFSRGISFNPVNIQRFTLVERLWKNGEYRPPWLWSIVEVLKNSSKLKGTRLISSPTAGGMGRGAHNCGKCDAEVLKGIEEFTLSQDISFLEGLGCDCVEQWKDILKIESYTKTQGNLYKMI
jgi:radical SAM enzyme (TIGR01210 family)